MPRNPNTLSPVMQKVLRYIQKKCPKEFSKYDIPRDILMSSYAKTLDALVKRRYLEVKDGNYRIVNRPPGNKVI